MTAVMIIYHGGDKLEFADCDGKSLGKIAHPRAAQILQNVACLKTGAERLKMIGDYYRQLKSTPAGQPAGFERSTGENQ